MIDQVALRRFLSSGQSLDALVRQERSALARLQQERARVGQALEGHSRTASVAAGMGDAAIDRHAKAVARLEVRAEAVHCDIRASEATLERLADPEVARAFERQAEARARDANRLREQIEEAESHLELCAAAFSRARLGGDAARAFVQRLADRISCPLEGVISPATIAQRGKRLGAILGTGRPEPPAAA